MGNGEGAIAGVPDIADDEVLYRSILLVARCFKKRIDGRVFLSSEAFADRSLEVSLFRHDLCDDPPISNPPRLEADQPVVSFIASVIREIHSIEHGPDGATKTVYYVSLQPDITDDQHRSHAIVTADPKFTKKAFDKLKRKLAILVESFVIDPSPEFVADLPVDPSLNNQ